MMKLNGAKGVVLVRDDETRDGMIGRWERAVLMKASSGLSKSLLHSHHRLAGRDYVQLDGLSRSESMDRRNCNW